jgi:hypothetical protein
MADKSNYKDQELKYNKHMQLLSETSHEYLFETENGCTFTRQKLTPANISFEIQDWKSYRALYEIDECTKNLFPEATHLIELSTFRSQEDPLFVAVPCHIKSGTKHQLIMYTDDDLPPIQVKLKKIHNWR